ncbi:DUF6276 family protein [Halorubrum sp. DTA98]|uniref:DUF6276 family protein n=1 Tax=Halorubrum sp. DTA98 TaxID=3402163 RepID=UPI003AB0C077
MACPRCGASVVAFAVPDRLIDHAPASEAAICTRCLSTFAGSEAGASPTASPDFSAVDDAFPDGDAGVALALACGLLESFALNRPSIEALLAHAEREGADVFLFFERLDADDAAFDLDRRRAALDDVL